MLYYGSVPFWNRPQKFIQLEGCSLCKPSFIFQRIKAQQDHFPSLLYHLTMPLCGGVGVFNSSFPVHSQLNLTPEIKGNWSQACSFVREMALKVRIEKPKVPSNHKFECRIGNCSLGMRTKNRSSGGVWALSTVVHSSHLTFSLICGFSNGKHHLRIYTQRRHHLEESRSWRRSFIYRLFSGGRSIELQIDMYSYIYIYIAGWCFLHIKLMKFLST